MDLQPVSSDNISHVGYENGNLHVLFYKTGMYIYYNVSQVVFTRMLKTANVAKFFNENIDGVYEYSINNQ